MATDYVINIQDADLMQILYEQDVDLGYNWRQNEPVKQLKEVDDIQKIKNDSMNIDDFFIDGETGEQIPISRTQQAAVVPANTQLEGGNNPINIDECLEILEHSIDDIQPRRPMSQTSIDERNSMVQNLTSLLQPTSNASQVNATPRSDDLWQQIDQLSELTGMNLQGVNQPVVQQAQNLNGNYNFNCKLRSANTQEPRNLNEQYNYNFNGMGSLSGASPSYEPSVPQAFPISSFPTSNSPIQTPPNYMQSPLLSDDGVPMDTSFVQIEPSNKEPSYPLNNFNNFNYQMDSSLNGGSPLSSLPEPGQGFFDYLQQDNNMNSDFAGSSTSLANLSSGSSSPFLNPPVSTYPPPPLDTPSSSGVFVGESVMSSSVGKSTIESYESDSGISLDQSPRGFDLLTLNTGEEVAFNTELALVKPEPTLNEQELSFSPDLNAINHNHTYNGTVGVKKQEKRKVEKSTHPRESRDEKKARELNIPFTLDEIILSPVEEYNEMLARTPLNPAQQALVKDIRRRGKNKVAAQNCRKRKIETISNMEEDVEEMRSRKQQLVDEQKSLEAKFESMKLRYSSLYQQIFSSLRDDSGRPYDPSQFRLEQVEGAVLLVPRQMQDGVIGTEGHANGEGIDFSKVKMEENR